MMLLSCTIFGALGGYAGAMLFRAWQGPVICLYCIDKKVREARDEKCAMRSVLDSQE